MFVVAYTKIVALQIPKTAYFIKCYKMSLLLNVLLNQNYLY
jgi:hypothetical protein